MKPKLAGWALLAALLYGPILFAVLIALHISGSGFSFLTHAMCSLAVGSQTYRVLFLIAAWGMALLHLPFLVQWPRIAVSLGGNKRGRVLFYLAGLLFVVGFVLFPIFTLNPGNLTSYRVHQVVASLYFPACAVIAIISWINLSTAHKPRPVFAATSILWMISSLLYTVPFVLFAAAAPPYPGWVNLLNWVFLACYAPWALVYGLALIGRIDWQNHRLQH